jgi:mitotic spindle assembly checkpoint protein MAD2
MEYEGSITLRGSSELVTEFFEYSVNNILYQRGIYPPETFQRVSKYGLSMVIATDEAVAAYLTNIVKQLNGTYFIY